MYKAKHVLPNPVCRAKQPPPLFLTCFKYFSTTGFCFSRREPLKFIEIFLPSSISIASGDHTFHFHNNGAHKSFYLTLYKQEMVQAAQVNF